MKKILRLTITVLVLLAALANAAEPVALNEQTYKPDLGVVIMQVNWDRIWKCNQYENAQLEALSFTKLPVDTSESVSLDLQTPSKLSVDNKFLPYIFVVQPGEYALTGFDVKVARSTTDVAHFIASKDRLLKDGKPQGGTFSVAPGEIIYIGHFGLDCGAEPFLWRYYVNGRNEFERYVEKFRQKFPFVKNVPVEFRLFSTPLFGGPFALKDATVK